MVLLILLVTCKVMVFFMARIGVFIIMYFTPSDKLGVFHDKLIIFVSVKMTNIVFHYRNYLSS